MAILRSLVMMLIRLFFRLRVRGLENVPAKGPVLIVPNHQSFLDAVAIYVLMDRPVRFLISGRINQRWWVRPFSRAGRAISIGRPDSPRELISALREARREIQQGNVVGIFAEGAISRIGQLLPFQRGYMRVLRDSPDAVVVPVGIDGAQESFLAPKRRGIDSRRRRWFRRTPVTIVFGKPLPADTPPWKVRQAVLDLVADGFVDRKEEERPLHIEAFSTLRRRALRRDFADHASGGPVRNLKVLGGAGALGHKLAPRWKDDEFVGVMLPPCIAAAVINLVLVTAGRKSINLNYTVSSAVLGEIRKQTNLRLVLTSRAFLERAPVELPDDLDIVLLEDVRESITGVEKLLGLLCGLLAPVSSLERAWGRREPATMDEIVGLLFSSGSTGVPKGVMLSHWNLLSNVRGTLMRIPIGPDGRLLGALPFFHVFGFMAALWLPLARGVPCTYHVNPLDARTIGSLCHRDAITHLFATPTFLARYARRALPWQFSTLEAVISGAEKLRPRTESEFIDRFGIGPSEGFGCTECSPVVTVCAPNMRAPGVFQRAGRSGSVGLTLPGVTVQIRDLETGEPLPVGESGMLFVRGPNIMHGYYKMEEKTAEALQDGWYQTGDVARLDEEGFLYITDRLARFSKIGGEMVPHIRVEEALQKESGEKDTVFAVTSVPDDDRGERLVVLHTCKEETALSAREKLHQPPWSFPRIWIPRKADFVHVEEIPVLGSGKLDLVSMRETAQEETDGKKAKKSEGKDEKEADGKKEKESGEKKKGD